ncbi:unnamed protein product [Absidia cylindrospora]
MTSTLPIYQSIQKYPIRSWRRLPISHALRKLTYSSTSSLSGSSSAYCRHQLVASHQRAWLANSHSRFISSTQSVRNYMDYPGGMDSRRDYSGGVTMAGADETADIARLSDPRTIVKHLDDTSLAKLERRRSLLSLFTTTTTGCGPIFYVKNSKKRRMRLLRYTY